MTELEGKDRRALSFGRATASYDRARPTYPNAALDWLVPHDARRVLDLGAGTGKLTSSLVARGLDTVAVDPSREMLDALSAKLPNVTVGLGSAESIPLPNASVDAILMGQAWHWVDRDRSGPETARVLRPGGVLGLVWNVRDGTDPVVAQLNAILEGGRPPTDHTASAQIGAPFAPFERYRTTWTYALSEDALLDLAASRSRFILMPAREQAAMREHLRALFDEAASRDGATRRLVLPYVTHCFRTTRPA